MGKQCKQWQTIFLDSKITTDGNCSYKIKTHLLLGRKAMTNLDSVLKSRDITLLAKVHTFNVMIFLVVMYGYWVLDHKEVSAKELNLLNWGAGEDSWESIGLQGDQTSQS